MEYSYLGIAVTLLFSAFFSGMESAFLSSNRLKIELDKAKGTLTSRVMGFYYKQSTDFLAMLLLGNNVALVFFGIFAAQVLEPFIRSWGIERESLTLIIQTVLSTGLVLFTAEFLPKALVQINPNKVMQFAATPMFLLFVALYLPTKVVVFLSKIALKILRADSSKGQIAFSKVDLEYYMQEVNSRGQTEMDNEIQILQNALDFDLVKARDCMIPRIDVEAVEINDDIQVLIDKFIESGYSKIIVYKDNIDHIIGYVHSFELFKKPQSIKQILLPIAFVPEAKTGMDLLKLFTENAGNIAVVVDEYGGTSGVVTIEDVIEEIFGDIEDEHDVDDQIEEVLEHAYRFSARLEIEYLNEKYHLNLEESESYETLGGLIIHHLTSIPEAGTSWELNDHILEIEKVSGNRIEIVQIKK